MEVFVDDRQKKIDADYVARRINPHTVTRTRCEVGDIVFSNVGLELKMADDFVTSFYNRDLGRQVANVVNNFDVGRLVVIGNWEHELLTKHKNAMFGYKSMLGTIATLTLFQVPPLFVRDEREFCSILKTMVDYASGDKSGGGRPVLFAKKNRTKEQVCSDMLTALDGVGRNTADTMLAHFKSLDKLVKCSAKELAEMEGIGKKTAEYIYEILH